MSDRPDGTVRCDRCDSDVGQGTLLDAVTMSGQLQDGSIVNLHLCYQPDEHGVHCANRVLNGRVLRGWAALHGDGNGPLPFVRAARPRR